MQISAESRAEWELGKFYSESVIFSRNYFLAT